MEGFSPEALELLDRSREVRIETRMADDAPVHRTVIWMVVDAAGRVLIRSYEGAQARWYREALASGTAAILAGDTRVEARVVPAPDEERVSACSRALEAKYAGHPSTPKMLRPEILDTTLELLAA